MLLKIEDPAHWHRFRRDRYARIRRTIQFLYLDPITFEDGGAPGSQPHASGFIVGFPIDGVPFEKETQFEQWGRQYFYLITNAHALQAEGDGEAREDLSSIVLRLTSKDGRRSIYHRFEIVRRGDAKNVIFAPRADIDLVALCIDSAAIPDFEPNALQADGACPSPSDMEIHGIGVGTDCFVSGYVSTYAGFELNHPCTKFGRLSLFSDEHWYPSQRNPRLPEQAHLIQVESAGGFSGSPVIMDQQGAPMFLLGVIKGGMKTPMDKHGNRDPQGVTAIEPAANVQLLLDELDKVSAEAEAKRELDSQHKPVS